MSSEKKLKQSRSLSQVFLKESWPCELIAKQCVDLGIERVVEIGPGPGNLTQVLLNAGLAVLAVEKDTRFFQLLETKYKDNKNLSLINKDFLQVSESELFAGFSTNLAVVGNVPYKISSPIIARCLSFNADIQLLVFLMQKEFVERVCASHNTKTFGSLSVFVQSQCVAENLIDVAKELFKPVPKVDSAILKLHKIDKKLDEENQLKYEKLVKHIFSMRRKTMRNSLKSLEIPESKLNSLPFDLSLRPENFSIEQYMKLYSLVLGQI